ncbi:hypothetical protein Tco_0730685, partial [Tanacetum coccineum]
PINDSEDLGILKAKADIGFFVGYTPNKKGYRIYNKRTRQIMETVHVTFDELTKQTAPVHSSPGLAHNLLTPRPISSGLVPNPPPAAPYVPPTNKELEILFQPMFGEYFETFTVDRLVPPAPAPQAPVLQILWGVINKANIDYAERIWEEFTQCIHSFIENKMNLALHIEGKKKVIPLMILGVRFTKLIINHLQSIHKFHKRPGSLLYLPYEEAALGYLKFSFKNTKRVRFGMAIPNRLISEDI